MTRFLAAAAGLAAVAGSANAAFFSFASDNDHTSWTFSGRGGFVGSADDPRDPVKLLVDDNNGALATLSFDVEFEAEFQIRWIGSLPIGGGNFSHNYRVDGGFAFVLADGSPLLVSRVENVLLTAIGKEFTWETSTAAMQGSDIVGHSSVEYRWFGADLPGYGLFNDQDSIDPEDFAFTLTVLNHTGKPPFGYGVRLDDARLPIEQWWSEGSYSGHSDFVPAPGTLALLGFGGLMAARRRRR